MARAKSSGTAATVKKVFAREATVYRKRSSGFNALVCKLMAERQWPRGPVSDMLGTLLPESPAGQSDTPATRFTGALHALVLERKAPELASLYPTNDPDQRYRLPAASRLWPVLCDAMGEHKLSLLTRLKLPVIDNDPIRCAALIGPLLAIHRHFQMPVSLAQVDAGAGLHLIPDQYHYRFGDASLGNPDSAVQIDSQWQQGALPTPGQLAVAHRAGCDSHPLNPGERLDQIRLLSYLPPEHHDAMARTRAAMRLAAHEGVSPVLAEPLAWLAQTIAQQREKTVQVILSAHDSDKAATGMKAQMADHGKQASKFAPLAWLNLKRDPKQPRDNISLTLWPSGKTWSLGHATADAVKLRNFKIS